MKNTAGEICTKSIAGEICTEKHVTSPTHQQQDFGLLEPLLFRAQIRDRTGDRTKKHVSRGTQQTADVKRLAHAATVQGEPQQQ
jgi:hypothetical protein